MSMYGGKPFLGTMGGFWIKASNQLSGYRALGNDGNTYAVSGNHWFATGEHHMSTDRKAGDLCAIRGVACMRPECARMNQCMLGFVDETAGAPEGAPPLQVVHLPPGREARKNIPLATGCIDYFPDALAAVAALSKIGNDQHNKGQPLHWSREKSNDHPDCLMRHFLDRGTLDDDGVRHSAKVAWRALAILQLEIERDVNH